MPDWVWNTLYDKGSIEKPEGDVASVEPINRIGERLTEIYTMQEAIRKFAYLEAALGNSVQIKDTVAAVLAEMEIRGETTVRRLVFSGGNTVDIINGAAFQFVAGETVIFSGMDISANNKSAVVSSVSGTRMTFPANTFTNGVSLNGVISSANLLGKGFLRPSIELIMNAGVTVDANGYVTAVASGAYKNFSITPSALGIIKTNTTYTLIVDITTNTLNNLAYAQSTHATNSWSNASATINVGMIGRQKFLIPSLSAIPSTAYLLRAFVADTATTGTLILKIGLFEGDVDINTSLAGTNPYQINVYPDNPQALTSLNSFDCLLSAKNMVRHTATFPMTVSGVTISYDSTSGEYTFNGTASGDDVFVFYNSVAKPYRYGKGVKRSISVTKVSGNNDKSVVFYHRYSLDGAAEAVLQVALYSTDGVGIKTVTRTSVGEEISRYISGYINAGTVFTNLKIKLQIEIGDPSTWEKADVTASLWTSIAPKDTSGNHLPLGGIVATYNLDGSVATWSAQDKLFQDADGKRKLLANCGKITFDGSTNVTNIETTRTNTILATLNLPVRAVENNRMALGNGFNFLANYNSDTEHFYFHPNGYAVYLFINRSRLVSIDAAGVKAWLAANPVTITYQLYTPIITELHADNQTAINAIAQSFDSAATNFNLSTSIGQIYVKAAKNITKVIDDIKAAIVLLG